MNIHLLIYYWVMENLKKTSWIEINLQYSLMSVGNHCGPCIIQDGHHCETCIIQDDHYFTDPGSSWPWSYGSWIYNYLCNQCHHHWCCEMESRSGRGVQHYVTKLVSDLQQVGGFLRVLQFPPPIKLTAMI